MALSIQGGNVEIGTGETSKKRLLAITKTASRRVQRGTNRPSGKRYKSRLSETHPRPINTVCDQYQAVCTFVARVAWAWTLKLTPMITRNSETNMTIQSSDLRQKSTQATPKEKSAEAMASARIETAYSPLERPRFSSPSTVPRLTCPYPNPP